MATKAHFILPNSSKPYASASQAGLIKVNGNGVKMSTTGELQLAPATSSTIGGVIIGEGLQANADGTISVDVQSAGGLSRKNPEFLQTAKLTTYIDPNALDEKIETLKAAWDQKWLNEQQTTLDKLTAEQLMEMKDAYREYRYKPKEGITERFISMEYDLADQFSADYSDVFTIAYRKDAEGAEGTGVDKSIFQVKPNGDTIIAGVLTVNGKGDSYFAGDVSINGHLTVKQGATITGEMAGDKFTLKGDLVVEGSSYLGNNAEEDILMIKGQTDIVSKYNMDEINAAIKAAHLDSLKAYRDNVDTDATMEEYLAAKNALPEYQGYAFAIQDNAQNKLFEVKGNGDTVIAGVVTVNGEGDSHFAGNVNIGGSLNVDGDITGGTNVDLGHDLVVEGTLRVKGNTFLGDDAANDNLEVRGYTSIQHQYDSNVIEAAVASAISTWKGKNPDHNSKQLNDYRMDPNGLAKDVKDYVDVFTIKDSKDNAVFQVKSNGDTIVGGILSVNGAGDSYIEGNLNINGSLVVEEDATIKGTMTGDDLIIDGNLVVNGNTTLGNDVAEDKLLMNSALEIAAGADINFGNNRIRNVAAPEHELDAVNRQYVDNVATGLDIKASVRVATTEHIEDLENITLPLTIDGVEITEAGTRILVKNQMSASLLNEIANPKNTSTNDVKNGIYVLKTDGANPKLVRAEDANTNGELSGGSFVFIEEGTTQANTGWVIVSNGELILDSTPIEFSQFSGAGSISAGEGLKVIGTTVHLETAGPDQLGGIKVGDGLTVDSVTKKASLTPATDAKIGGIKAGTGVTIDETGALTVDVATEASYGTVMPGTGLAIVDGRLVVDLTAEGGEGDSSTGALTQKDVDVAATPNKIVKRDGKGGIFAKDVNASGALNVTGDITSKGKVAEIAGLATQGDIGVSATVGHVVDKAVSGNDIENVLNVTTSRAGNYLVYLYIKVPEAVNATVEVHYNDGAAQVQTIVEGDTEAGSYSVSPLFVNSSDGIISIKGAGAGVKVSADIIAL